MLVIKHKETNKEIPTQDVLDLLNKKITREEFEKRNGLTRENRDQKVETKNDDQ